MEPKKKLCFGCNTPQYIWKNFEGKKWCKECASKLKKPKVFAPRVAVKKISDKLAKKNVLYTVIRKHFLDKHKNCEAELENCSFESTEIHHKKGRGEYMLDEATFLAVCRNCHTEIELNPAMAKERGFSESRLT
jgi:hypothetical protein